MAFSYAFIYKKTVLWKRKKYHVEKYFFDRYEATEMHKQSEPGSNTYVGEVC